MKILSLETSTELASVALVCEGAALVRQFLSPPAHSAHILPAIKEMMVEAGLTSFSELDLLACGVGPGAFTGVRLACSVAQGLALGANLPVVPVCSLLALAEAAKAESVYCAVDARMGEVYLAAYRREADGWREVLRLCCVPPEQAPLPPEGNWVGCGNAFAVYPALGARLAGVVAEPEFASFPEATAIASLARVLTACDPALLAPLYVRDRVAQTVAERLAMGGRA